MSSDVRSGSSPNSAPCADSSALGDRIDRYLDGIVEKLLCAPCVTSDGSTDIGLADGSAGIVVSLVELYLDRGDERLLMRLRTEIDRIVAGVQARPLSVGLYEGLAGVSWAIHYACNLLGHATFGLRSDCTTEIDSAIFEAVTGPRTFHYDLIRGLAGLGLWGIRLHNNKVRTRTFRAVIARLDALAERTRHGVCWRTPVQYLPPIVRQREITSGYYDLGLAHGVPGVVALISNAMRYGVATPHDIDVLKAAVHWLVSEKVSGETFLFPCWAGSSYRSRLAWCYGDLGVATALAQAASALTDKSLFNESVALAIRALSVDLEHSGVVDSGLCHGGSGVAHIADEFFKATGDKKFAAQRDRWLKATFDLRYRFAFDTAFASYMGKKKGYGLRFGFLTGITGIALALLAVRRRTVGNWNMPLQTTLRNL